MELQGFISEVFSSFQGEGGNVRGSCFGKKQIFVRFAGCNIAHSEFGTSGCFFCDTPCSQNFKIKNLQYETFPSSQEFISIKNPLKVNECLEIIENYFTEDLHSISFTGGEPMCQLSFLLEMATALKEYNIMYPLYLETNGTILPNEGELIRIGELFAYCCCDIKDRSSNAAEANQWKNLVQDELAFIKMMISVNILTFAKIVVTSETSIKDIEWIAQELSHIKYNDGIAVGLAIQPVFLRQESLTRQFSVSHEKLNQIFLTAAQHLPPESLTLSIQAHKFLNLL